MLRLRYIPLGQYQGPYQAQISQISQNFPVCFTSSSILPMLDQAIASGNALNKQVINGVSSTAAYDGGFKITDVANAVKQVQALRDRYASEDPNTQYCNSDPAGDSPDGYPYNQHYRTLQALTGIYQFAAGVSGGGSTLKQAGNQLQHDLNPLNALPPLVPSLPVEGWMQWALIGVAAVAVYMSMKKSTVVVVQPQE